MNLYESISQEVKEKKPFPTFIIKTKQDYIDALDKVSAMEWNNEISRDAYDKAIAYLHNQLKSLKEDDTTNLVYRKEK